MTATNDNVVTLRTKPRLLEAPPPIARPEPRNSHDIETIQDTETEMLWLEILQRMTVLKMRHGRTYALTELDDRIKDL